MTAQTPTPDRPLRIGARGSALALAQAHETRDRLMAAHGLPESAFAIVVIKTTGDAVQDRALSEIGGKGLFTKEIEEALLDGAIDLAVHSMKDMPTILPEGLALAAYLPREDVRDAFVSHRHSAIAALPQGAVVGSSSLRRRAQLLNRRPDLRVVEFRGNVQTRLRKLEEGVAEATFLAAAGLNRLGLRDLARQAIAPEEMLPAVAQGATLEDGRLVLRGEIVSPDGARRHATAREGAASDGAAMGADAAAELKALGGPDFFAA
jgi:hydroxymethylbilane synthase